MSFKEKLKNNKFVRSVLVLSSGNLIAQILGVVTTPIVSRLYAPDAFGAHAVIVSIASIISSVSSLGLNSAIMAADTDEDTKNTFMVAMSTTLLINLLAVLIIATITPFKEIINSGINPYISCLFVFIIASATNISSLLIVYTNRLGRNRTLFVNSLVTSLATLIITIPLGFADIGCYGLLIAAIVGSLVNILHMSIVTRPYKKITWADVKNVFKVHKDYVVYQYPSNIMNTAGQQIPNQLLSNGFGNAALGGYAMSEKVLGIPSRLIAAPIGQVYFRTATEYQKEDKNIAPFTFKMVAVLMALSLIPVFITIFWGSEIFQFVLGPEWGEAGDIAGLLIIYYVFDFCATCVSYCRVVIGKQKVNFSMSILKLIVLVSSMAIGVFVTQNMIYTLILFSATGSIYMMIDMAITLKCLKGKYWIVYLAIGIVYLFLTYGMYVLAKYLI